MRLVGRLKMVREISIVEGGGVFETTPTRELSITETLDIIKSEKYKDILEPIRKCKDKKKRYDMKLKLDYILFGGTFNKRNKEGLKLSSGIAIFDLDDTTDDLKKKLMKDEYINFIFVSPSGNGLKVGVKIPYVKDDVEYKEYWNAISQYLDIKECDEQTKDISRACYFSSDKDLYHNPNSKTFKDKVELTEREVRESKKQTTKTRFEEVDKNFIEENIFPKIKGTIISNISLKDKGKYPSRSERDVAVIDHLLLKGFEKYIKSIFDLYPIGEKYQEETNPLHYLEHQIEAGREYTGVNNPDFSRMLEDIKNCPVIVLQNKLKVILDEISKIPKDLDRKLLINELATKIKIPKRDLDNELNRIAPPNPVSFLDILNKKQINRDFYIKGLIPKGQLILIGARPENFKTQLIIGSVVSMLSGKRMAGLEVSQIPPKIFMYCLEMSQSQFSNASKCFLSGLGIKTYPESFKNLSRQEVFSFDYEKELELLKDYEIVTIDSLRRVLKGSEDDSTNTAEFYSRFLKKLIQMGKTVILVAHSRKGGKDGVTNLLESDNNTLLDLVRGSGDIGAQLDSAFILHRTEEYIENGKKEFVVCLRNCKNRDALNIRKSTLIKVVADLNNEGIPIKTTLEPYDMGNVRLTKIEEAILIKRFIEKKCIVGKEYQISNKKLWEIFNEFSIYNSKLDVSKTDFDKILDRMKFPKRKINYLKSDGKESSKNIRFGINILEEKNDFI